MRDSDGNIIMEEKEVKIPMYKPVVVFDVSQTEGEPLPTLAADLKGDVRHYEIFMEALRRSSPVPMEVKAISDTMDGYFSLDDQAITLREGMSEVQTISAAVHEITHAKLHNIKGRLNLDDKERYQEIELFDKPGLFSNGRIDREKLPEGLYCYDLRGSDDDPGAPITVENRVVVNHAGSVILAEPLDFGENNYLALGEELNFVGGETTLKQFYEQAHPEKVRKDRNTEEVEAESVSFAVCCYYGIETGENSFGYIASWSDGMELKELRSSLETINRTADGLISDIDRNFAEICKERGIDLSAEQVGTAPVIPGETVSSSGETPEAQPEQESALYLVNDAVYVHIQPDGDGHCWDAYLKEGMQHFNDGIIDLPQLSSSEALLEAAAMMGLPPDQVQTVPLDFLRDGTVFDQERLYLVDEQKYLHIQPTDDGYDFTIYDKDTMRELDGGQLDQPDIPVTTACLEICKMQGIDQHSIQAAQLDMVETLQEAQPEPPAPRNYQSELIEHFGREDDKLWDTKLDEYPMPDQNYDVADLEQYGIYDQSFLPISKDMAAEMIDRDLTVYAITSEGAVMAFDRDEVETYQDGSLFAILREEWQQTADFKDAVQDRMNHQQEREKAFLDHAGDSFAIYQVKIDDVDLVNLRYVSMDRLQKQGLQPDRSNYELAYTAPLPENGDLNTLWEQFNIAHPADYMRPSMSVSDIVAIRKDGVVSCHYVDSIGFQELSNFLQPDNYLKSAEMQMEDDYDMVDGVINNGPKQPTVAELEEQVKSGQPISLLDLAEAVQREKEEKRQKPAPEKKPSILAKIRKPLPDREKTAPEKSAEKEHTR
jgi:hypothetical protein